MSFLLSKEVVRFGHRGTARDIKYHIHHGVQADHSVSLKWLVIGGLVLRSL